MEQLTDILIDAFKVIRDCIWDILSAYWIQAIVGLFGVYVIRSIAEFIFSISGDGKRKARGKANILVSVIDAVNRLRDK